MLTNGKKNGIDIGIYTLADIGPDPFSGKAITPKQRLDEIIKAAQLADEAGLDVFGLGEHHRLDYAVSSPAVVLASIAPSNKEYKINKYDKCIKYT